MNTKNILILSIIFTFAIGLYAAPSAFAEHSMNVTVENAMGSSTPGCEPDCFLPSTVTIGVGGMVTFANNDSAAHTSTSGTGADGPSGVWDSSLVMMGAAYTTPALDAGEYPYFCMVHPWMEGLVIVTDDHGAVTSEPERSITINGVNVDYEIYGAEITNAFFNDEFYSIIIELQSSNNGTLKIGIPDELLDDNNEGFFVLVNGMETNFNISQNNFISNLVIPFKNDSEEIEIIGILPADHIIENALNSSTPGCEPDCFIPSFLIVDPGDVVRFVNNDGAAHTTTSGTPANGPDGNWDSSLMPSGYSIDIIFEISDAGQEFPYFCMVHPWMEGTIIVSGGGATSPSQAESSQAQDDAEERIAAAEAAAAAAEAEAAARIAEAEAAARIAAAEAAAAAAEAASQQAIS